METVVKIKIGDKYFKPKDEFGEISKTVLQMCNFNHSKSNKNLNSYKMGDGKAAFTNGLSVKEFKAKYNVR